MKKLIYSLLILAVAVFVGDRVIGYVLRHAYERTRYGEIGRENLICDSVRADIVVLGSSRALHHYVPTIITDSTGLSCYNCGFEGEGIVFHYALLRQIEQRHHPRLIIYELTYDYDVEQLGWMPAKANHIRTMSRLTCRDSILNDIDRWESVKMKSHIYPYNSLLFNVLLSRTPTAYDRSDVDNGYMPLYKHLIAERFTGVYYLKQNEQVDSLKYAYLNKLISEFSSRLIIFVSPRYLSDEDDIYDSVADLARKYDVPFHCLVRDPALNPDITYWEDDGHLNDRGAHAYTRRIMPLIKQRILKNLEE